MARYSDVRDTVYSLQGMNAELEKISDTIDTLVSREDDVPNFMESDLDFNGYRLINLADPESDQEPVTLGYARDTYGDAKFYSDLALGYQQSTQILYDDFFGVWRGAQATDPVGTAEGQLYYNTTDNTIKSFDGTNWNTSFTPTPETFTDITVDSIQLTGGTGDQGKFSWNADDQTVDLITNGTVLQLGQELLSQVRNTSGSTIPNGTPVMITGTLGASGRVLVAPMDSSDPSQSKNFLGVATEDIPNNQNGKVARYGKVRGLDLTAFNDGDLIYCDNAVIGGKTNVEPVTGLKILLGIVIDATPSGTLQVRVQNSLRVSDLSDVDETGVDDQHILVNDAGQWVTTPRYREVTTELTGTVIDPALGTVLYKTLTANTTFTESLVDGDSLTLMVDDGASNFTVTWPTISWVGGSAPTLQNTGYNVVVLWKVNTTLYGLYVGAA